MTNIQRYILIVTAITIGLMTLFPPYTVYYRGQLISSGYAFIFGLPNDGLDVAPRVDVSLLSIQIIAVLLVCFLLFHSLKKR